MRGVLSLVGGGLWLALVGVGLARVVAYESAPGTVAAVPDKWLCDTAIPLDRSVPTLVVAVHPHCPCTRATLSELARVLAVSAGKARTHLLFILPEGTSPGWEKTDLWAQAAALPGATLHSDPGGRIAAHFGAQTSGQVYLFAPTGQRLFAGGVTPSRGHEGDNAGTDALISLLTSDTGKPATAPRGNMFSWTPAPAAQTPVYGCPLSAHATGALCAQQR